MIHKEIMQSMKKYMKNLFFKQRRFGPGFSLKSTPLPRITKEFKFSLFPNPGLPFLALVCALCLGLSFAACTKEEGHAHKAEPHEKKEKHKQKASPQSITPIPKKQPKQANEATEPEVEVEYGKGKAVEDYSKTKGIKLAKVAIQRISVVSAPLSEFQVAANTYKVPVQAVLFDRQTTGIYLQNGDWFRFVSVRVLKKGSVHAVIKAPVASSNRLVTKSAPLLRLAELNAIGHLAE